MANIQTVLSALDVFNSAPDKASIEQANAWLQEFQHSPEAWATCNVLLLSHDAPAAARLFAAQTFRSKVIYDLDQVEPQNLFALRDTLLSALEKCHTGPRTIIVQLSLAITGLALQLPAWTDAVPSLIATFGRNPSTVPTLLQFLTLLPEEVSSTTKIPITDDDYKERYVNLLSNNAKDVLGLLSMYIAAPGITPSVQNQIFICAGAWLTAGEIDVAEFTKSPLFPCAFDALASEELFDNAVDVVCELVHETQEVHDNMNAIELIVPKIIALKPQLVQLHDDPDRIKGLARIFAEAGETYRTLLFSHPETFFPIVEAIGMCSAYPNLDIVPITFPFWMRLAQVIGKKPSVPPVFIEAYKALMNVIIRHLHFPADDASLTGQEAEDFRAFRHVMGDTLKDCCFVLRADNCLLEAYQMITTALSRGPTAVTWQDIEAPLFAMRSMGAQVDPQDQSAVPKIMDLIPSLPEHPRIRYAALLIIARYTEWLNEHSDYIPRQLQYISAGFESTDIEVMAAAGQALKYLCQDCKSHLVEFLPTLHTFLKGTGTQLSQDDRRQVYEAIAHVISAMPMEHAAESLRSFALDILAQVHTVASLQTPATKAQLEEVSNGLENLEVMLHVVQGFGESLPAACQNTAEEAWAVFDSFLVKYGSNYDVAERTTRVLRHGIHLFAESALGISPSIVQRMSFAFEATGYSSYLWIAGKFVNRFGGQESQPLRGAFRDSYERATQKIVALLQSKLPGDMPDVLEDYLHFLLPLINLSPDIFFESSAFPNAFRISMAALSLIQTDVVFASLDLFRTILEHDCLEQGHSPTPPKFLTYAAAIRSVINKEGPEFIGCILNGLAGDFPEDSTSIIVTILRSVATNWPTQLVAWLPPVLQQIRTANMTPEAKTQFLNDVNNAVTSGQYGKVKYAVLALNRVSRKARERRRAELDR
ncbi:ARM repeat-containing protein [Pluteus cervinus]|uniref:ARM repeat-containing protein n=1 Tax=Pluteus cervinus TaxID=181527 RepID=A0ACD3BH19_9AGAR|nr:ARM repeat-containing protein [Pluteus cervinus]